MKNTCSLFELDIQQLKDFSSLLNEHSARLLHCSKIQALLAEYDPEDFGNIEPSKLVSEANKLAYLSHLFSEAALYKIGAIQ